MRNIILRGGGGGGGGGGGPDPLSSPLDPPMICLIQEQHV